MSSQSFCRVSTLIRSKRFGPATYGQQEARVYAVATFAVLNIDQTIGGLDFRDEIAKGLRTRAAIANDRSNFVAWCADAADRHRYGRGKDQEHHPSHVALPSGHGGRKRVGANRGRRR